MSEREGSFAIDLTDAYEAFKRATADELSLVNHEAFSIFGMDPQVRALLRLLGREDLLPGGAVVTRVERTPRPASPEDEVRVYYRTP